MANRTTTDDETVARTLKEIAQLRNELIARFGEYSLRADLADSEIGITLEAPVPKDGTRRAN